MCNTTVCTLELVDFNAFFLLYASVDVMFSILRSNVTRQHSFRLLLLVKKDVESVYMYDRMSRFLREDYRLEYSILLLKNIFSAFSSVQF